MALLATAVIASGRVVTDLVPPRPGTVAQQHPPYVDGPAHCHIEVVETHECKGDDTKNLFVEGIMWDAAGNKIGAITRTMAGATTPLEWKSALEDTLVITPEHQGDYVQFNLGNSNPAWTNLETEEWSPVAYCYTDKWDRRCEKRTPIWVRFLPLLLSTLPASIL